MLRPRRFRAPFHPFRRPPASERLVSALERAIKGALFSCSMCGNCLLQETAFICPLLCPKGLRNGPCGSGASERCCVDPDRPCVWHLIYHRAERLGRLERLLEVQAPLDWTRVGRETWSPVIGKAWRQGLLSRRQNGEYSTLGEAVEHIFYAVRQPDWWQGDDRYHPPALEKPVSGLQAALERGEFVITAEIAPPRGADLGVFLENSSRQRGLIHGANVTQNPMANPRMSGLACCELLNQRGIEPILQLTARDYNRLLLQSEALAASALGIHNLMCLTGDAPTVGRGPSGMLPFDLDATQMLWILRRMRDKGCMLDGRPLDAPPRLFLGAAASPNDPNPRHEVLRLEKKINAGAQFLQTQLVYDTKALQRWLQALDERQLLAKVHVLVGIGPLRSLKTARFLQDKIPDITIPANILKRLEESPSSEKAGLDIAMELIEKIREIPGVSGVHIMPMGCESLLPQLLGEAGRIRATVV